jgi:hypothetical protein
VLAPSLMINLNEGECHVPRATCHGSYLGFRELIITATTTTTMGLQHQSGLNSSAHLAYRFLLSLPSTIPIAR